MSWEKIKFSDLFEFQKKSKTKAGEGLESGKYAFFTSSGNLSKYLNDYHFEKPSLIFGTGGQASVHFIDEPFAVSTDCFVVQVKDPKRTLAKYVYYYLSGHIYILEEGFKGAGLRHISKEYISKIQIPIPPLPTQKRIAEILNKADALRRKDQELIRKYDELARAIFIDMFGDPMKNEKGWVVKKLADVVKPNRIITYGIVQAGENVPDGIPYIRTGDIKNGKILSSQLLRTSPLIADSYKRSTVNKGDIIMSIRATVGTVALLPDELDGANLTQGTARISPDNSICRQYLFAYLKSDAAQNWISINSKGATFREITLTKLRELPVLVPDFNLQQKFEKQITHLENQMSLIQKNNILSDNLFNSLISKMFQEGLN